MLSKEEWQEYADYLDGLSNEEMKIEMEWLKTLGEAKKRGSLLCLEENYTIQ
jgi:hypothetical protein